MRKRIQQLLSTTLIAFGLASPALSQNAPSDNAAPVFRTPAQTYSDTQLQNFINASRKVVAISQEYTPKLEAAGSDEERDRVFREADDKMVQAVEEEGLSVDEFNSINHQIPQDPQLEKRISELLQ
ncbi:MAG TPA: DUF4168 domain-containing protein [Burkholderiaceae bacterium]|nr:DUF4168 domain-containing protein [Burkholderiaceae bacterium]